MSKSELLSVVESFEIELHIYFSERKSGDRAVGGQTRSQTETGDDILGSLRSERGDSGQGRTAGRPRKVDLVPIKVLLHHKDLLN